NPSDFYQYLGVRSTRSTTSTKTSIRRTIRDVFNAASTSTEFIHDLKELLEFLEFEESFKVDYITRINKLFFSGSLTKENFRKYFEEWWDEKFIYTKRKQENPSWSIPYYNNNFKDDDEATQKIVDYLNSISNQDKKLQRQNNSDAKIISIDLFDTTIPEKDIEMISHLENLDIVYLDGIKIRKKKSNISIDEMSSGEYHLLISLIGIFASIKQDSLILIDEPEISLHPNWQMRYITFLKNVFLKYPSCHFILATHSHFIVSDLEKKSSSVVSLNREKEENKIIANLIKPNTYGWSAEDVLYRIFSVRTTRNYYMGFELRELLHMISVKSQNKKTMQEIFERLEKVKLNQEDPLNQILRKARLYIDKI
ncbi:MAG: ATP-binding protein, partial [Bacteroidales bacterium]|nr:ATP-binding protein [Bacteroidales bacterium]